MVDGRDPVSPKIGLLRRNAVRTAHECDDIESGASALSCIRGRCSESELSAPDVANALAISPRTLHRTLAAYGETFGRKLIEARVEVAARMLGSRLFDRLTIAEVGRRAGFVDPSHFARMCRAHLGHTPAVLRQARDRR